MQKQKKIAQVGNQRVPEKEKNEERNGGDQIKKWK